MIQQNIEEKSEVKTKLSLVREIKALNKTIEFIKKTSIKNLKKEIVVLEKELTMKNLGDIETETIKNLEYSKSAIKKAIKEDLEKIQNQILSIDVCLSFTSNSITELGDIDKEIARIKTNLTLKVQKLRYYDTTNTH